LTKKGTSFGKEHRGRSVGQDKAPGPGTYDLQFDYDKNPTAKTFGLKLSNSMNLNQVGPGHYDPSLNFSRRNADTKSFGVSRNDQLKANSNPGPGTYENLLSRTTPTWKYIHF
jgi:hypothetical protein